jgi:hypothetical protein
MSRQIKIREMMLPHHFCFSCSGNLRMKGSVLTERSECRDNPVKRKPPELIFEGSLKST